MNRSVTPWSSSGPLHCDSFRRDSTYTNWRPRGSGDWLLIYTEAGEGLFTAANGESLTTQPGEVVLYAPHEYHDYGTSPAADRWDLLWVHFLPKPHWKPLLTWPVAPSGQKFLRLRETEAHEGFRQAMRRMIDLYQRHLSIARDLAQVALEEALLWSSLAASLDPSVTMDDRVRRAIDYMIAHYREPLGLEKLARQCGLSVSRLAHLFKEQTGIPPQQYLEDQRMQAASRLLRLTGLAVAEIAREVGFEDPFYFSNRFRRFSGKSPRQFREQN